MTYLFKLNEFYVTIITVIHYVLFDNNIPDGTSNHARIIKSPSNAAFQGPLIAKRE
jgi:hypothetical protein